MLKLYILLFSIFNVCCVAADGASLEGGAPLPAAAAVAQVFHDEGGGGFALTSAVALTETVRIPEVPAAAAEPTERDNPPHAAAAIAVPTERESVPMPAAAGGAGAPAAEEFTEVERARTDKVIELLDVDPSADKPRFDTLMAEVRGYVLSVPQTYPHAFQVTGVWGEKPVNFSIVGSCHVYSIEGLHPHVQAFLKRDHIAQENIGNNSDWRGKTLREVLSLRSKERYKSEEVNPHILRHKSFLCATWPVLAAIDKTLQEIWGGGIEFLLTPAGIDLTTSISSHIIDGDFESEVYRDNPEATFYGLDNMAGTGLLMSTPPLDDSAQEAPPTPEDLNHLHVSFDINAYIKEKHERLSGTDRVDISSANWNLWGRNAAWLPHIQTLAHDHDNMLFIVGMGHLYSERGLLADFTKAGLAVRMLDLETGGLTAYAPPAFEYVE
jgi:hypothetical protein